MLRLWSLWSCGDRGSDLHQIPRPIGPVQRTRTEAAPLRMDVAQFDISVTHQPVAVLGLGDADRLADRVGPCGPRRATGPASASSTSTTAWSRHGARPLRGHRRGRPFGCGCDRRRGQIGQACRFRAWSSAERVDPPTAEWVTSTGAISIPTRASGIDPRCPEAVIAEGHDNVSLGGKLSFIPWPIDCAGRAKNDAGELDRDNAGNQYSRLSGRP